MRAPNTPQHKEMQPSALLAFHQLQRVYFAVVAPHVEGSTLSIIVLYCTRTNFPTRQISTVLFLFETPGLRSFPQSTANPLLKQTCIIICSILILFACLALCVWSGWSLWTMLCAHWIMLHRLQTPLWGTVLDTWINGRLQDVQVLLQKWTEHTEQPCVCTSRLTLPILPMLLLVYPQSCIIHSKAPMNPRSWRLWFWGFKVQPLRPRHC